MTSGSMVDSEVLVDLVLEGAHATLRRRTSMSGKAKLFEDAGTIPFDENSADYWKHGTRPVTSLKAWLAALGDRLPQLFPVTVHPEVRAQVWGAVFDAAPRGGNGRDGRRAVREAWGQLFPWAKSWAPLVGAASRPHMLFVVSGNPRVRSALRELLRQWNDEQPHGEHVVVALEEAVEMLTIERELKRSADLFLLDLSSEAIAELQALRENVRQSVASFIGLASAPEPARQSTGPSLGTFIHPDPLTAAGYRNAKSVRYMRDGDPEWTLLKAVEVGIYGRG